MRSTGFFPTTTPGTRLIACVLLPDSDTERTLSIAEALSRFTPTLAVRNSSSTGEQALFLDLTRSLTLFKPEWLPLKIEAVLLRFGASFHFAFAADPGSALSLAQLARATQRRALSFEPVHLEKLPLHFLENYLFPFLSAPSRDADEVRSLQQFIGVLERLGIQTLGELAAIPLHSFTSRFRKSVHHWVHRVFAALQGTPNPLFEEPWPQFRFPEKLEERFAIALEDPTTLSSCSGMEALLFCVKTLSDRIFARLRGRALRLSACEITVELENHKQISIALTLPVPQSASSGLLPILRDRLNYEFSESQKKRLDSPISTLFLRATETAPASFSQKHFFSPEEQQSEAWESFLGRVLPRLGEENVFFAHPVQKHRPESSWRKITRELLFQELTTKNTDRSPSDVLFPERPTLLLKEPVPLSWDRDLIRCEGLQKHWQVLKTSFAERLSGEWWEEAGGFAREYYQIIAHELSPRRTSSSSDSESPIRLWVYFTPQNQAFLHGYFD